MEYTEQELVRIARRENNPKRNYLVVNPLQGKHVPVSPARALDVFAALGERVRRAYPSERLLFVGFAETATAIGACVASVCGGRYVQTTREEIAGARYLFFEEEHSHATEQKLIRDELETIEAEIDRIVFVEDEVTTGKTILNGIAALCRAFPDRKRYAVASLLNGMDAQALETFGERGIDLHYLVKTEHSAYGARAQREQPDGVVYPVMEQERGYRYLEVSRYCNARRVVHTGRYAEDIAFLVEQIREKIDFSGCESLLVLGTEEFMYPALVAGRRLEEEVGTVRFHATTRSPIAVSKRQGYPLQSRYALQSLYDAARETFVYNLARYDKVLVVTDAKDCVQQGLGSLLAALSACGNTDITVVVWKES